MPRTHFNIDNIAQLARLSLTEDEKNRLGRQFEQILAYIDQLNELDTEQVEPTSHVLPVHNVFREDEPTSHFPPEDYLALAPRQYRGHYEVPQII